MKSDRSMKELLNLFVGGVSIENIAGRMKTSVPNAMNKMLALSVSRIRRQRSSMESQANRIEELINKNRKLKSLVYSQKKEIEQLQSLRQSINSLTSERSKLLRKIRRLGGK